MFRQGSEQIKAVKQIRYCCYPKPSVARHVLERNTYPTIFKYFQEVQKSGAKYLITTTAQELRFPKNPMATQMSTGGFHYLNFKDPFNFPQPLMEWQESPDDPRFTSTMMAIWDVSVLPANFVMPA
jgi:hypothetical protein